MTSNLIAAFAAPSLALAALGAAEAVPEFAGNGAAAYSAAIERLSDRDAERYALALFERADLDGSGALDPDEYAALAVVIAELARLNGFIVFDDRGAVVTAAVPAKPAALTRAERTRIDAVARSEFYDSAGSDARLDAAEFAKAGRAQFARADRNADGALKGRELAAYAAEHARLSSADA